MERITFLMEMKTKTLLLTEIPVPNLLLLLISILNIHNSINDKYNDGRNRNDKRQF